MITYHSYTEELRDLIADLGRVYAEPITRSILLIEEIQSLYEKLFEEYREQNYSLQELFSEIIYRHKAYGGSLDLVTMMCVAKGGHLEILRALRNGSLGRIYPLHEWISFHAAAKGQLEVLRALRDGSLGEVCPWSLWATEYAAYYGHLEVLRALRNGSLGEVCPWNKVKCREAAHRYPEILIVIDSGELD